jgi:hypothetical protein
VRQVGCDCRRRDPALGPVDDFELRGASLCDHIYPAFSAVDSLHRANAVSEDDQRANAPLFRRTRLAPGLTRLCSLSFHLGVLSQLPPPHSRQSRMPNSGCTGPLRKNMAQICLQDLKTELLKFMFVRHGRSMYRKTQVYTRVRWARFTTSPMVLNSQPGSGFECVCGTASNKNQQGCFYGACAVGECFSRRGLSLDCHHLSPFKASQTKALLTSHRTTCNNMSGWDPAFLAVT